jgi:hypothetical protein
VCVCVCVCVCGEADWIRTNINNFEGYYSTFKLPPLYFL